MRVVSKLCHRGSAGVRGSRVSRRNRTGIRILRTSLGLSPLTGHLSITRIGPVSSPRDFRASLGLSTLTESSLENSNWSSFHVARPPCLAWSLSTDRIIARELGLVLVLLLASLGLAIATELAVHSP